MSTAARTAVKPRKPSMIGGLVNYADERLGIGGLGKKQLRKVFPDHWSFMLGEIALWSFVVLLITGVFLSLWFDPSMSEVHYEGSYDALRGMEISAAYASTLDLSFDVRGGLLMRQMHHWAAMIFIAGMFVHLMRVYFTGAFRKPRELNWVIGCLLLLLGSLEGFTGYSLPDDLLSGTGVRAADGFMKSIPVVGTYMSFFVFNGEFPGDSFIPRFYVAHVLLLPALLLALIGAHMMLLVYQKHTQWPGPGKTNDNVVGYPMMPIYAAKAGGYFFVVFGVSALMAGLVTINPVWTYGPYDPSQVTAGSQPDWYMGWPDGALRIMPGWETEIWGVTLSWNVFLPIIVLPGLMFTILLVLPFIEAWITGDKREHHLLQRPREAPNRTATMVALMTFIGLLWAAGGNDILALKFDLNLNYITYFIRIAVFVLPPVAFVIARRWCISLQRQDNERLLHGFETGVIMRSPEGGYTERHAALPVESQYVLVAGHRDEVLEPPAATDRNGVSARGLANLKVRSKLSRFWFGDNVPRPTREELADAHAHAAHELEGGHHGDSAHHGDAQSAMIGHGSSGYVGEDQVSRHGEMADGHQFDGRHEVAGDELRK